MKAVRTIALLATIFVLLLLVYLWVPVTPRFSAHPQPTQNYHEAMAQFAELQARDTDDLFPECRSTLLTHGKQVSQTIVLLHGITNCPAQFAAVSQQFYDLGYNVLIPRLPHHGLADPMTTEIAQLTAEELVAAADEAVDIATGLGEEVTVVGFSTGGTMAAWVAEQRPEVDETVLLSPFLSPNAYPAWVIRPLARVLLLMPNQFWWWDGTLQDQTPGPRYGYPRYPTHAMAQVMRLSFALRSEAKQRAPQSKMLVVVTNAGPRETVDNAVTAELVEEWQRWEQTEVVTFELASTLDLKHNYIDPNTPDQPVDVAQVVHPLLMDLLHREH
jgi:pimeloyl-ACP methyl ester carboxylesterase